MDDAKRVYIEDLKDRNAQKSGACHKKRRGGRTVRMPSDFLSRKEKRALNGEVQTYKLGEPVKWRKFLEMPEDIQKEYISRLDQTYAPTNGMLSYMLGTSPTTVSRWRAEHNAPRPSGKARPSAEQAGAWMEWLSPTMPREPVILPKEPQGEVSSQPGNNAAESLCELLRGLAGSGVKVTIEVIL